MRRVLELIETFIAVSEFISPALPEVVFPFIEQPDVGALVLIELLEKGHLLPDLHFLFHCFFICEGGDEFVVEEHARWVVELEPELLIFPHF